MIAIVDYGVGNLFSLRSSFAAIGQEVTVTADEAVLRGADKLVLPGVGASATRRTSCGRPGWTPCSGRRRAGENRFSASAWGCSSCLSAVWNTGSMRAWAC